MKRKVKTMRTESPITLEQELSIRSYADDIWRQTWAEANDLNAQKAFKEGFYIAFAMGLLAVRATNKAYDQRQYHLNAIIALLLIAVAVAFVYK